MVAWKWAVPVVLMVSMSVSASGESVAGCLDEEDRVGCVILEGDDAITPGADLVSGVLCYVREQGGAEPATCPYDVPVPCIEDPDTCPRGDMLDDLSGLPDGDCDLTETIFCQTYVIGTATGVVDAVCPWYDDDNRHCEHWANWCIDNCDAIAANATSSITTAAMHFREFAEQEGTALAEGAIQIAVETANGSMAHAIWIATHAEEEGCNVAHELVGPLPPVCS